MRKILLVEDEPVIALAEETELRNYGYQVHTVKTGEEAVLLLSREASEKDSGHSGVEFDLVLMDIDLGRGGIDGTEAARQILEKADIPIIFLSSHTEREIVEKTERITTYGYVVKNSGITVLDASIKMAFKLFDEKQRTRQKDRRLKQIAENYPDSYVSIIEKDFTVSFSSGQGFVKAGLDPQSFQGKSPEELFGEHTELVRSHYEITFQGEESNFQLNTGNLYQEYRTVPLYDTYGNVHQILVVAQNITDKMLGLIKEKEQAAQVRKSQENYRNLFEMSIDGIMLTDASGIIRKINPAGARIMGFDSEEEMIGRSVVDFYQDPGFRKTFVAKLLKNNGVLFDYPFPVKTKEGKEKILSCNIKGELNEQGELESLLVSARDLSRIQKLSGELLEKNSLLENLQTLMEDFVAISDARGNFLYVSPSHGKLGYHPEDLLGRNVLEYVHTDDAERIGREWEAWMKQRTFRRVEYRYRCADGSYRRLETIGRFFDEPHSENPRLIFSSRDITERRMQDNRKHTSVTAAGEGSP